MYMCMCMCRSICKRTVGILVRREHCHVIDEPKVEAAGA